MTSKCICVCITWFRHVAKPSRRSRYVIDLALCGHGKGIAFMAIYKPHNPATMEALKPLTIHDVIIDNNECSDKQWCLNLDCSLNEAKLAYFKKKGISSQRKLVQIHEVFEKIKRDLKLQKGELGVLQFFEKPPVYLSVKKRHK